MPTTSCVDITWIHRLWLADDGDLDIAGGEGGPGKQRGGQSTFECLHDFLPNNGITSHIRNHAADHAARQASSSGILARAGLPLAAGRLAWRGRVISPVCHE